MILRRKVPSTIFPVSGHTFAASLPLPSHDLPFGTTTNSLPQVFLHGAARIVSSLAVP